VLADLGHALRREVACEDCGFAIELDVASGEALLWPDGGDSAAQLANSALAYARLHPGPNEQRPECQACVSSIRIGGRLLGELAMVPGPAAAKREMLQAYAALGAELAALAIDRLQAAETLRHSQNELRQLSAQLMNIQEAERQRIAGDIHDVIGQSLSVVKVSIEEAERGFIENGSPEVAAVLGRLVPWVKTALGEVRRISMDLRPATIDDLGILPTLSWFFREFGDSCRNIAVVPRIAVAEADIPEALKIVIFRILQEAFSNVVKHAQATRIQVVLQKVGGHIQLAVIDNGCGPGFPAAATRSNPPSASAPASWWAGRWPPDRGPQRPSAAPSGPAWPARPAVGLLRRLPCRPPPRNTVFRLRRNRVSASASTTSPLTKLAVQ
jgi:signal transduction histidine kinase